MAVQSDDEGDELAHTARAFQRGGVPRVLLSVAVKVLTIMSLTRLFVPACRGRRFVAAGTTNGRVFCVSSIVLARFKVENVFIMSNRAGVIRPGMPARWSTLYGTWAKYRKGMHRTLS